jgi:hypothetical protein
VKKVLSHRLVAVIVGMALSTLSPLLALSAEASPVAPNSLGAAVTSGCTGVQVFPTDDLAGKIDGAPTGTTFCIHTGTYSLGAVALHPKDNDRLIGDPVTSGTNGSISAPTKLIGSGAAIIDLEEPAAISATGVVIKNLDISGAQGTTACKPKCGRGISQGTNLTVSYSHIHGNMMSGIGGIDTGAVVNHVEIDHNGSTIFYHCCAAGIKSTKAYTLSYSYVHDNIGNGVWQDGCGTNFKVTNSTIIGNTISGVRYEHNADCSGSAWITGNTIQNNNSSLVGGSGGVAINSAPNGTVVRNTLGGNKGAGIYVGGTRGPLTGTSIHDNIRNGDVIKGCALTGVSCYNNH